MPVSFDDGSRPGVRRAAGYRGVAPVMVPAEHRACIVDFPETALAAKGGLACVCGIQGCRGRRRRPGGEMSSS